MSESSDFEVKIRIDPRNSTVAQEKKVFAEPFAEVLTGLSPVATRTGSVISGND